jgi:riboflavin kinase/FMN adenylyltransferase
VKILTLAERPGPEMSSVVSVGNFDGVHRGHQALIREMVKRAKQKNKSSVLVTFDPHTRAVLFPELPQVILTTFEEKAALIERLGVDYILKIPFDAEFSRLTPEEFVKQVLIERLHAEEWVLGEGHAVGRDRAGGKKFLREVMSKYHIKTFTADLLSQEDLIISSTQIRGLITEGRLAEAVKMLGHPYLISAERSQGLRLGSQLGFPTLNFKRPPSLKVLPPPGVCAAELEFKGSLLTGALYYGECPTFTHREAHLEFHALEMSGEVPETGETAHLWVSDYIRGDRKFSNADELVRQMKQDINKIRNFFSQEKRRWL